MNQFVQGGTAQLHAALTQAVNVKKQKVIDNRSALITEGLADAPVLAGAGGAALKLALGLSPGPLSKSIVSGLMLLSAVPVVWSLLAESKKDAEDYRILKGILNAYEASGDEDVLNSTQLFVKLHSTPAADENTLPTIREVRLMYNKIPPHILELMKAQPQPSSYEKGYEKGYEKAPSIGAALSQLPGFALTSVFNAFALSVKSCTTELLPTIRTIGKAWGDVVRLASGDLKRVWQQARGKTLLETKNELFQALWNAPFTNSDDVSTLMNPHMQLAESLHPLQDELRSNARMRLGTAMGVVSCTSFISLALANGAMAASAGNFGAAAGYIGLSALLSVPPLRVLSERQSELAQIDQDRTMQILERFNPPQSPSLS